MNIKALLPLFSVAALSAVAAAQTVVDGSFEDYPETSGAGFEYNVQGSAWTYSSWSGLCYGSTPWHDAAEDGMQYAFIQSLFGGTGELTGTINGLSTGNAYNLDFYLGTRNGYEIDPLTVSVGGTVLATGVAPADLQTGTGWTEFTFGFVATGPSETVDFLGSDAYVVGVGDLDTALDHVTAQAVPEPAPLAALGVGALGLLVRRRRQR